MTQPERDDAAREAERKAWLAYIPIASQQPTPLSIQEGFYLVWDAGVAHGRAEALRAVQTHRLMAVRHVGNNQYRASCTCGHICAQEVDWFGAVENWQLHLHEAVRAESEDPDARA
jgi:hypothetical protein